MFNIILMMAQMKINSKERGYHLGITQIEYL